MTSLVLIQIIHDASLFLAYAVMAMPFFILAMNHIGRKKNVQAASDSLPPLVRILRLLWIAGPVSVMASFAIVPASLAARGYAWEMPSLTHPALVPYTASLGLWFCALVLILRAERSLEKRSILIPLLGAGILLFLQRAVLIWPFAGLPEGLAMSDAVIAVLRSVEHDFFHALFPMGLLLLALLSGKNIPPSLRTERTAARKLLCATAAIGALPETISSLGTITGYFFRSQPLPPPLVLLALRTATTLAILALLVWMFFAQKERPFLLRLCTGLVLADILLPTLQILCS